MQRSRRQDPYPPTFEVPLAVSVAVGLALVLGAHVGRAVANVLAGRRWEFPQRSELFTSLPALLRGDASAGLVGVAGPWASPQQLAACVAATEVVVFLSLLWAGKVALDRWGPARLRGMATATEVERLLGRGRLRANRAVIRPDLYGRRLRAETTATTATTASTATTAALRPDSDVGDRR